MPAEWKLSICFISAELGFASAVISILFAKENSVAALSIRADTIFGGIKEGVPPPKKIVSRRRLSVDNVSAAILAICSSSAHMERSQAASSSSPEICELKSQ